MNALFVALPVLIIQVLKSLPVILEFILTVKKWVDQEADREKRAAILKSVTVKVDAAVKAKSGADIEALFK